MLLLAPTDVAAINIEGAIIHSALGIPIGHHGRNVPRLSDKMFSELRNKLSEASFIIIDEISISLFFFFFFFFLFVLDVPHLTNEHRTQDCIAS